MSTRRLQRDSAKCLVSEGIGIIFGGSKAGLMGALADAAMEAGGEIIGVIPESLVAERDCPSGPFRFKDCAFDARPQSDDVGAGRCLYRDAGRVWDV